MRQACDDPVDGSTQGHAGLREWVRGALGTRADVFWVYGAMMGSVRLNSSSSWCAFLVGTERRHDIDITRQRPRELGTLLGTCRRSASYLRSCDGILEVS